MSLSDYSKKRNFSSTPEPAVGVAKKHTKLAFVVQQHQASHLHYDFRLEIDGVLKSWAVPKGPSMNPHEHHLAVMVEDHPYSYKDFEGEIPKGSYGAGTVKIWDKGYYEPRKSNASEDLMTLKQGLESGHITFVLHGKKLKGEFALVRLHNSSQEKAWLLIKKADKYAKKSLEEKPSLSDYPKKPMPKNVNPMLCILTDEPFSKEGWRFEIKWDGYRAIASKRRGDVRLYSRNHNDFTDKFEPVMQALHDIKHDVVVDGEIVSVDSEGVSHFEWLQNWQSNPRGVLQYQIFDILWCDGVDVQKMPLNLRKFLLKSVLPKSKTLHLSDDVEIKGEDLFKQAQGHGLEGVVAKRDGSQYKQGERGNDWLKIKTHMRQEFAIGGYTEPKGSRKYLGSLLLGVFEGKKLIYAGRSGGGMSEELRKTLSQQLAKIQISASPFNTMTKLNSVVHWVRPELVCEVSFSEWTQEGRLRQPKFEGLRSDKKPAEIKVEKSTLPKANSMISKLNLPFEATNLDKVFFPKHGYTKDDLFEYYISVAKYILPYIKGRALSLNRMPDGISGQSFFQKNNPHLPEWASYADIFSESNNTNLRWLVGRDEATLLYAVQLGSVEINPWNSKVSHLTRPDWAVIDLDPHGVGFDKVIETAKTVHAICQEWKIPNYVKTSGIAGLHIYIPLHAKYTNDQAKNLAHLIALETNSRLPKTTSVLRSPDKRQRKVYIDFLQNREGQTVVAPYSVRPTADASISMPLAWSEVDMGLDPSMFNIKNALKRIKKVGDLWTPVLKEAVDLKAVLEKID
ncbi:MAG: DNA ligase D [Candidatus Woesebacteria bacterium]|jgi:bifunctional non-homologous end joining protein LigD